MFLSHLLPTLQIQLYSVERVRLEDWWNYRNVNSPFTRVYYVLSGLETYVEHNGQKIEMSDGKIVVTPPFQPVNYHCNNFCELYGIMLTAQLASGIELFTLKDVNWEHSARGFIPELFRRLLELNPGKEMKIANPFNKAYNETIRSLREDKEDFRVSMETEAILKLILSRFLKYTVQSDRESTHLNNKRMLKVLEYIEQNIESPLALETLAEQVNLNPTYLSNTFAETLKIRPTTYIKNKRIEKAQLLLISTQKPLKQISWEVGIQNPDYFFRIFKKQVGCTPTEYRNNYS